ncbi:hypothetical protein CGG90_24765, partial [Vibrio parahaemolyticus]
SKNSKRLDEKYIWGIGLCKIWNTCVYEYRLEKVEVVSDFVKGEVSLYTGFTAKPDNWPTGKPWSDDYKDLTSFKIS